MLNSRPYYLRMVLDQGYWPDSLMVASSDQLRHDVLLIKRLGFNGVRKHQKSEDPRWLYWCDVLGLCVWGEMPSAYGFSSATVHGVMEEWKELVERDISHPCIVAWVPTNESWGVPELMNDRRQVDFVRALYHMTRALDGTRPVVGNDGWEMPCGDLVCVHDYEQDPAVLVERYGSRDAVAYTLEHVQPDRRRLVIDGFDGRRQAAVPVRVRRHRLHPGRRRRGAGLGLFGGAGRQGTAGALPAADGGGAPLPAAVRLLLHPADRHLPRKERPADRRPRAEGAGRGAGRGHARHRRAPARTGAWTRSATASAGRRGAGPISRSNGRASEKPPKC